jgi:type 1 fimbria pilin
MTNFISRQPSFAMPHFFDRLTCLRMALVATALGLLASQARAQDSATVDFSGQLMSGTCRLMISDNGINSPMVNNRKTVNFGVISTSGWVSKLAGSDVGPSRHIQFALKASDGISPCDVGNANIKWLPSAMLNPDDIGHINSLPVAYWYLKNATPTANNGSDVWLKLLVSDGSSQYQPPLVEGTVFKFTNRPDLGYSLQSSVTLIAQLVQSVDGTPSAGMFTQSIAVTVSYQ